MNRVKYPGHIACRLCGERFHQDRALEVHLELEHPNRVVVV